MAIDFPSAPELNEQYTYGGQVYEWNGTVWRLVRTSAAGPTGATGPTGAPGTNGETGPTGASGTAGATGATGPTGASGTAGATGPTGATGTPGTSVTILGEYADLAALQAAHPTGSPGDSYLVDSGDLYVWSANTSQWVDVGNIEGPTGPTGTAGATGPTGPAGAASDAGLATSWWLGV